LRNALLVTYYFPPAGGPGIQYPAKHAKFLRSCGYNPIVLTVAPEDYPRHSGLETPMDPSRGEDLPLDVEIHRTRSHQPFRFFRWLARHHLDLVREFLFIPDAAISWTFAACRRAHQIARYRNIDLIYTVVPPYSTAWIGRILQRTLRRPWVLDLRDPWTGYFLAGFPTKLHYWIESAMERSCMKRADHVIMPTPTSRENLLERHPFLAQDRVTCLPMGYDADDFSGPAPAGGEGLKIDLVYSGVFCGAPEIRSTQAEKTAVRVFRRLCWFFSFAPRAFDRTAHSPKFLLDALRDLFAERPDLAGKIRFIHLGPASRESQDYARKNGLGDVMETRGYVSHAEAIRAIQQAQVLFFCLADSPRGDRNDCVPQKVYQYMAARRPILALCPPGDARDILERSGAAVICNPRDLEAVKAAVLSLAEGTREVRPDPAYVQSFECRALTARLGRIFDRMLESDLAQATDRAELKAHLRSF
jgi:glycosyltransferase involved in cell wall biosynthesis